MMKRIIYITITALLLLPSDIMAYDEGDFQIWHTENQDVKVRKKTKLILEEQFRYGDLASELYYQHYDAGLLYSLTDNLDVSANYRQIYELKKGDFEPEYRPHINATVKWGIPAIKFEDRNRFEYRFFNDKPSSVHYRNQLTVKFPLEVKNMKFEPYVADEIFASMDPVALTRNRMYIGLTFDLTKNIKPKIYYLLQSTKSSGRWNDANVLGLSLKLDF